METTAKSYTWLGKTVNEFLFQQKKYLILTQNSNKETIDSTVDEAMDCYNEFSDICKNLYRQFCDLQRDFAEAELTPDEYHDKLKKFTHLFAFGKTKVPNHHLHADEIAAKLEKYLTNNRTAELQIQIEKNS